MRPIVLLCLLALVAACATPRERCVAEATEDLRVVNLLIRQSRATIERGYAVRREPEVRPRLRLCYGRRWGGLGLGFCNDDRIGYQRVPVAVDLAAERATLASLLDKRTELRREAEIAVTNCRGRYPDA